MLSLFSKSLLKGRSFWASSLLFFLFIFLILFNDCALGNNFEEKNFFSFYSTTISNFLDLSQDLNSFSLLNLNNNPILFSNTEINFSFKDFEISGFYINKYEGYLNNDSLEFLSKLLNRETISIKTYDIYFTLQGYSVGGISLKKHFSFNKYFSLSLASKLLIGLDIQDGILRGQFSRIDEESYGFNLYLAYNYNHNYLTTKNNIPLGKGMGYSLDFGMSLNNYKNFFLDIIFENIIGEIYWLNLPYLSLKISSEREYIDENGNIVFGPLISGYEIYRDYFQKIPLEILIKIKYVNIKNAFIFEAFLKENYQMYSLKFYYYLNNLSSSYIFSINSPGVKEYNFKRYSKFFIILNMDCTNFKNISLGLYFIN